MPLERRPLGRTGLQVTPLALTAGGVRGVNPKGLKLTADEVERAYHEHGVNTFFANTLFPEVAEGIRRLIRAGHRDDLVLLSMVSLPFGWSVRRAWEKQSRAFGIDHIDIFLMGWVQGRWYLSGRSWPAMERLRQEGKVRAIGWSTHNRRMATELARERRPDVMMIRYNAAHRGAERDIFEPLGDDCPGIIGYTATRWGMLMRPPLKDEKPMTAPECYRFALSHPAVNTVMCAARSRSEVDENVAGVLQGPLDEKRLEEVRRFGDLVHAHARGGKRWMFR